MQKSCPAASWNSFFLAKTPNFNAKTPQNLVKNQLDIWIYFQELKIKIHLYFYLQVDPKFKVILEKKWFDA